MDGRLKRWKMRKFVIILICSCSIFACSIFDIGQGSLESTQGKWGCQIIPGGFNEQTVVGTWQANYGNDSVDQLVIRSDNRYKQVFHRSADELSFETDWKNWWIEERKDGGILLHLEGMHICFFSTEMCLLPEGGGGDHNFINPCSLEVLEMKNEGLLAIVSTENFSLPHLKNAPRSIALQQMQSEGALSSIYFLLQTEN